MSSACPSFTFSCSNISCSIWYCCGGGGGGGSSNKDPEQNSEKKQYQPPPPQVITTPDHLKPTSAAHQPPELPPAQPPPATAAPPLVPQATVPVHARPPPPPPPQTNLPAHHAPSTGTHYPSPSSLQHQTWHQTLVPPALPPSVLTPPPKLHDPPWPLSSTAIIPPSDVQSTMMHKHPPQPAPPAVRSQAATPPQAPWPARQPSKTYQARSPERNHLAPPHVPFKTYQAAASSQALRPAGPLVDSQHFMEYYPQEHPEYFVQ